MPRHHNAASYPSSVIIGARTAIDTAAADAGTSASRFAEPCDQMAQADVAGVIRQ